MFSCEKHIESALSPSWPAENKVKRFSVSLTFVFSTAFAQNALLSTAKPDHVLFCLANANAKHYSCAHIDEARSILSFNVCSSESAIMCRLVTFFSVRLERLDFESVIIC